MANEQPNAQKSGRKYRVIHGSIGLMPGSISEYRYKKGDLVTDMAPEEAALHVGTGLLVEEK